VNLYTSSIELDLATDNLSRIVRDLDLTEKRAATLLAAVSRLAVAHRRDALAEIITGALSARDS
jgi:hypothetical protein